MSFMCYCVSSYILVASCSALLMYYLFVLLRMKMHAYINIKYYYGDEFVKHDFVSFMVRYKMTSALKTARHLNLLHDNRKINFKS